MLTLPINIPKEIIHSHLTVRKFVFDLRRLNFNLGLRETETEGATLALYTVEDNRSALGDNHLLSHEQPQAGTIGTHLTGVASPVELGEQMMLFGLRHP